MLDELLKAMMLVEVPISLAGLTPHTVGGEWLSANG